MQFSMESPPVQEFVADTPFIRQKTKELEDAERSIEFFRTELLAAENRRDGIKKEIALYRSSRPGIQRAPPEILCAIFLLIDDKQGVRNYRLSLVCKAWRALIDGTPSMWTQVCTKWAGSTNDIANFWRYMDVCLDKSRNSPLDVTLDFSEQPFYGTYVEQVLQSHFTPMGPTWASTSVGELIADADEDGAEMCYNALAETTLNILGRKVADHNMPWQSLHLSLPNIATLELVNEKLLPCLFQLTELEFQGGVSTPLDLTIFQAMKRLKTDREPFLPDYWNSGLPLKHLELTGVRATFQFLSLTSPSFGLLESLTLYARTPEAEPKPDNVVPLPLLQHLHVDGDDAYLLNCIEAPALSTLHLGIECLPQFGDTSLLHNIKELCLQLWPAERAATAISLSMQSLESLLKQCKSLVHMTIICYRDQCNTLSAVLTVSIRKLRAEGAPLNSLTTIRIEKLEDDGESEDIDFSITGM